MGTVGGAATHSLGTAGRWASGPCRRAGLSLVDLISCDYDDDYHYHYKYTSYDDDDDDDDDDSQGCKGKPREFKASA